MLKRHLGAVHVGTSGWSYDHWENVFYPPDLPARERLGYYAARFTTVELNASFYRWPREAAFASWRRRLPPGFLLSVKAPRGLTHGKKLFAPEAWIERIARCWHELGEKRAVLLVQLPPDFPRDDARLDYFLARASRLDPRQPWSSATPAGTSRRSTRCWNGTAPPTAS